MLHSDILASQLADTTKLADKNQYRPITHFEAAKLALALQQDAASLSHASLASFFEALGGVADKRYTWSVVKFYYSMFYACRAIMMLRGYCVFYIGRSPYLLRSEQGEVVVKKKGNTHSVIFVEFRNRFSSDELLSQSIDQVNPFDWLEEKRNKASYKSAPFSDPAAPNELCEISGNVRRNINAYLNDDIDLYAFDSDHALVAYPLKILCRLNEELKAYSVPRIKVLSHYVNILGRHDCFTNSMRVSFDSFEFP